MSKSEDELRSPRRDPKRLSLMWDILIALASIACFIIAGLIPLIANAATVSPPPALLRNSRG